MARFRRFLILAILAIAPLSAQTVQMNGNYKVKGNFTAAGTTTVAKLNNIILADQQSGSTADAKFTNACSALPSTGGTIDMRGFGATTQTLSANATAFSCGSSSQPVTIIFDPATTYIPGSTSQTVLAVNSGNVVSGLTVNASSLGSYAGNMVTFPGTCTNTTRCIFTNFNLSNGVQNSGITAGTAILLQATNGTNALSWAEVSFGKTTGFQNGIYVTATGSPGTVYAANSNHFMSIAITNAVNCITLNANPGDVIGNKFIGVDCQYGSQASVGLTLTAGGSSNLYGNEFMPINVWDYPGGTTEYSFNSATTRNFVWGLFTTAGAGATDNGTNNNIIDLYANHFAGQWPIWKTSGDFLIQSSANGHALQLKGPDTQWNITPHVTATGDLGFTLAGTGTVLKLTSSSITGPNVPITASLTTSSGTSDNVTVTGMTSSGHCSLTATNSSAAINIATTYVSVKTTNQITVTHTTISGMTYDILCTPN